MSVARLVPERPEDLERIADMKDMFVFAPPEPVWPAFDGERARAAGRLFGFVGLVGIGVGLGIWVAGEIVADVVRGLFS